MDNRIRIGNQTAFSASRFMDPLEFAVEHGFGAFEWFADKKHEPDGSTAGWEETDIEEKKRNKIRQIGESHDISYTVHAPWQANPLHPRAEKLLKRSVDFAQDIGANLVNLHLYTDRGIDAYVNSLVPVISYAASQGIRLSIENTPLTGPTDFNDLFRCLDKLNIDTSHVGMCLDIGHANLFSGTWNDYIRYIDELEPGVPIIHLHLHENWGDRDSHLPLYTGPARDSDAGLRALVERLQQRRYNGAMIMEQWPQPPELLTTAEQRFRALLSTPKTSRARHVQKQGQGVSGEEEPEPHPRNIPNLSPSEQQLIDRIAAAHAENSSWRQRLTWIRELVLASNFTANPEQLASLAVYLRFLGTGELACNEDGRHFRPHHHAQAALAIESELEALTAPEDRWILRKIHPWLPSYHKEFQRSEPLTRIRDIAHRNDIPKALKGEIKHRLQNKLHRCAGPEDLKTASEILARITQPEANYAPQFVAQFRIFHQELSEFFNASSLDQRLEDLLPLLSPEDADRVHAFQTLKAYPEHQDRELLEMLELLTLVRDDLSRLLPDADEQSAQSMRLTDIGLEDFAFALLSEVTNRIAPDRWDERLQILDFAVRNVRLCWIEAAECGAVSAELSAWRQGFDPSQRFHLLRLKATLDRIHRITAAYADRVLRLFPPRAAALGHSLGVTSQAIRVYSEGDIRGNIIFQLARLAEGSESAVRRCLNSPPWSAVAPGEASGRLIRCPSLRSLPPEEQPLILLLDRAQGDEEIPSNVVGILLCQSIPHLSHLGVRARQAGIPFAASEERGQPREFDDCLDRSVQLQVSASGLTIRAVDEAVSQNTTARDNRMPLIPLADLGQGERGVVPLSEATAACCGAKAASAARLLTLARESAGLFTALDGLVVPFGAMESSLAQAADEAGIYRVRQTQLQGHSAGSSAGALEELRQILLALPLAAGVCQDIERFFGPDTLLAVRSSANGEDLEGLASAGLYDSCIGVSAGACTAAIRQVWASLWTKRAYASRLQNGIPHADIHMAVLIQKLVAPEFSFIMHTTDPISPAGGQARVELALGLGETLASAAQPGTPYRLLCNRDTGESILTAGASYSLALQAEPHDGICQTRIDYSRVTLSTDPASTAILGKQLAEIARFLEARLDGPQDVEGVIANDRIHIVQTRPQQGAASSRLG